MLQIVNSYTTLLFDLTIIIYLHAYTVVALHPESFNSGSTLQNRYFTVVTVDHLHLTSKSSTMRQLIDQHVHYIHINRRFCSKSTESHLWLRSKKLGRY